MLPLTDKLPSCSKSGHILPGLKTSSLLSLGKVCDAGCKVNLDHAKLEITKDNTVIITGKRNQRNGLWEIPFHPNPKTKLQCNNVVYPPTHGGLYPIRYTSNEVVPQRRNNTKKPTKCINIFKHLNAIIDDNVFDNLIEDQLKQDKREHKLNVII